jgi:hypothetical protein
VVPSCDAEASMESAEKESMVIARGRSRELWRDACVSVFHRSVGPTIDVFGPGGPRKKKKKKKKNLIACRGLGRVVGPLLAARALPLCCAASTMLSTTLLAIYLTRTLAVVICGSGSTCVSLLSS